MNLKQLMVSLLAGAAQLSAGQIPARDWSKAPAIAEVTTALFRRIQAPLNGPVASPCS
jgi:hypothetical protein